MVGSNSRRGGGWGVGEGGGLKTVTEHEGSRGYEADLLQLARDPVPDPSGSTSWREAYQL